MKIQILLVKLNYIIYFINCSICLCVSWPTRVTVQWVDSSINTLLCAHALNWHTTQKATVLDPLWLPTWTWSPLKDNTLSLLFKKSELEILNQIFWCRLFCCHCCLGDGRFLIDLLREPQCFTFVFYYSSLKYCW